ncbi:MAG TPA: GEVED domain-containing protein [Aequorivita sp.]|nr:GEVED domain-containing protein [Aequorivita sp.]
MVTSNFTVPINVNPSSTVMRVSLSNNGTPGACETDFSYGEVEDYTINFPTPLPDFIYENGAWTPSHPAGVSTSADNIHIINGTTVFSSSVMANNLEIDAGATLNVESILSINGDLINNGELVFVSTATSNGELAPISGTSVVSGDATVQRYIKNKRSYRMLSSAVTTTTSIHDNWQEGASSNTDNPNAGFGTHITGSTTDQMNGFDGTITGNPSMFTVNVGTQMFEAIDNTDINTLTAGDSYLLFVRGDRSTDLTNDLAAGETVLRATGSLHVGSQSQNFATVNAGNNVMFGNPYQSTVDMNTVFANSTNINTGHYYVYDPTLGTHGGYVTVALPGGTNTSGSAANQYLQPGQGAQAATLADGPSAVLFDESDKAPGMFTSTNANPLNGNNMLTVQLFTTENFNNGGSVHDSFGIIFGDGLNNAVTNADAVKPMNFYENLGRDHNGTYLSIEKREMPQPAEVFPLYSAGYSQSEYTLKMNIDGLEDTFLYLDDHFTGTSTLIEGETIYTFGVDRSNDMSVATDRFSMRVEQRLGVDDNGLLSGVRLFPNSFSGNTFYVNAPKLNGEQLEVSISDLTGRSIYEETLDCSANTVTVPLSNNIASGVYLVTLKHGGESNTLRLIKK